jgi:4-oxalocrotonate tautomerase
MPLITVKVLAGVFTGVQKRDIVEHLTDALVDIQGEAMRPFTWCIVEEVPGGDWGMGGDPMSAEHLRARAAASATP